MILVTGTAGFIGSHVALHLLARGESVVGFDSLNDYYDVRLKQARLDRVSAHRAYTHVTADLADRAAVEQVFSRYRPRRVIHLAAQAGVRYAAEHPHVYAQSNLVGFLHVLEGCRHHGVEHLVFASTSSVYGANTRVPFSEHASAEHPLSFYAATKKANEVMAHSYAHLYGLPCTGLRFFTVYGPWGRPDMALFGEKDWQQLAVIRRMARDLDLVLPHVDAIHGVPTVRDEDGLAKSSRNAYLSAEDRAAAAVLPRAMDMAIAAITGGAEVARVLGLLKGALLNGGFASVDYAEIRDADSIALLDQDNGNARLFVAARIGGTRLIDNKPVTA